MKSLKQTEGLLDNASEKIINKDESDNSDSNIEN